MAERPQPAAKGRPMDPVWEMCRRLDDRYNADIERTREAPDAG